MIARYLNEDGTNIFQNYIKELAENQKTNKPDLNNYDYSSVMVPAFEIDECKKFLTRMELGKYLFDELSKVGLNRENVINKNIGLFNWLSYIYFDEICPIRDGIRKIREMARYICSTNYTDYYRHYIAATYDIYSLHNVNSNLFLNTPVFEHNDFMEQIASRQKIISYPNLISLLNILYLDYSTLKPKKSSSDRKKPGNIRRFIKLCDQLELTYDIFSIEPENILSLLPNEFEIWK